MVDDQLLSIRHIRSIIDRNEVCQNRCQQAVIALLVLRKRRCKKIDHNLLGTVAQIVWETRGTKVWKPE
uniref:Uncharacterized protein n=1 Tax=viral metagenome TaxID=1070528 RepID=A0A6C0CJA4_9ZZZZ